MKPHFKIILTCWNAEKWIECSVKSILQQAYKNWQLFIVDDCSTDKTFDILKQFMGMKRVVVKRNPRRLTKLRNLVTTVRRSRAHDEDVIVFVDGDDMLYDHKVLNILASVYESEDVWVTWGSYREAFSIGVNKNQRVFGDYKRYRTRYPSQFARPAPKNWDIRGDWRYSHLKTTKYFLWKNIRDETFKDEKTRKFYSRVDDFFMVPLLEMAGPNHSKYIDRTMYVRSVVNHYAERTEATLEKTREIIREVKRKKPYLRKTRRELIRNGRR